MLTLQERIESMRRACKDEYNSVWWAERMPAELHTLLQDCRAGLARLTQFASDETARADGHFNSVERLTEQLADERYACTGVTAERDWEKARADTLEAKVEAQVAVIAGLQAGIHGYIADVHSAKRALAVVIHEQGVQFKMREAAEAKLAKAKCFCEPGEKVAQWGHTQRCMQQLNDIAKDALNSSRTPEGKPYCAHEHLDMDGQCKACGADKRGI